MSTIPAILSTTTMNSSIASFVKPILTELPEELLVKIVEGVGSTSLYHLALLSRRLHYLCLPLFFIRCQCPDPAQQLCLLRIDVMSTDEPDLLSGLRIALFLPSIKHLYFTFYHTSTQSAMLVAGLSRAQKLVARLTHVQEVTLHHGLPHHDNVSIPTLPAREQAVEVNRMYTEISSAFGNLLNTLLEKSCTSITFNGVPELFAHQFWSTKESTGISRAVRGFLTRKLNPAPNSSPPDIGDPAPPTSLQLDAVKHCLSTAVRSTSRLRKITITSSPNFFSPPLSTWIISVLDACHITSLIISEVKTNRAVWEMILPIVSRSVSGLQELSITGCLPIIPENLVLNLLYQINSLRSLSLGRFAGIEHFALQLPLLHSSIRPQFSYLSTLCVPLDWLFQFLAFPLKMPNLSHITIYPRQSAILYMDLNVISVVLPSIVRRLEDLALYPSISFNISFSRSIHFSMSDIQLKLPSSHGEDLVEPVSQRTTYAQNLEALDEISPAESVVVTSWIKKFPAPRYVLNRITSTNLELGFGKRAIDASELAPWIGLFPKTQLLTIHTSKTRRDHISLPNTIREAILLANMVQLSTFDLNGISHEA